MSWSRVAQGTMPPPPLTPVSVYCSQFAQCGWRGYRLSRHLGVQPKPCPKCGGEVLR